MAPKPQFKDQSLLSYIMSHGSDLRNQAPLDQDNAHILLAEAMIQYGNCVNFDAKPKRTLGVGGYNDMEEIQSKLRNLSMVEDSLSTSPSSTTVDHCSTPGGGGGGDRDSNTYLSDDDCDTSHTSAADNNASAAPLVPDFMNQRSAEATALRLLVSMKDPHGYKASDALQFLATESDAPQNLLPLPPAASSSAAADETTHHVHSSQSSLPSPAAGMGAASTVAYNVELRGNETWAPPRPQLILQLHKKRKKLKLAMKEQLLMCNDCGMEVQAEYFKYFRFCHYFGKYSCTSCHSNNSHVLPANIVYKWDFHQFKVSNFAHTVLSRMSMDPLFDVEALNPRLAKKIGKLRKALELREKAVGVAKYLISCRLAKSQMEASTLSSLLSIEDAKMMSLQDLCLIRIGTYNQDLEQLIESGLSHVYNCDLCQAHGFICEICRDSSVIYPFQEEAAVIQCKQCFACFHTNCFEDVAFKSCSKCARIKQRKEMAEMSALVAKEKGEDSSSS